MPAPVSRTHQCLEGRPASERERVSGWRCRAVTCLGNVFRTSRCGCDDGGRAVAVVPAQSSSVAARRVLALAAVAVAAASQSAAEAATFSYTGEEQVYTVPAG